MPDESSQSAQPQTIRGALISLNPKIVLAFFLVFVAAFMVIYLVRTLTSTEAKLDAGTIALFASFVTMFIKMASDGTGYQFSSSSGSDKKDDQQARVSEKLADKVPVPPPAPPAAPTTDALAAALLSNGQRAYFATLTDDEAKKKFLAMSDQERTDVITAAARPQPQV